MSAAGPEVILILLLRGDMDRNRIGGFRGGHPQEYCASGTDEVGAQPDIDLGQAGDETWSCPRVENLELGDPCSRYSKWCC